MHRKASFEQRGFERRLGVLLLGSLLGILGFLPSSVAAQSRNPIPPSQTAPLTPRKLDGLGAPLSDLLYLPNPPSRLAVCSNESNATGGDVAVIDTDSGKTLWRSSIPAARLSLARQGKLLVSNHGGIVNVLDSTNGDKRADVLTRLNAPSWIAGDPRGRWLYSVDPDGLVVRTPINEGAKLATIGGRGIECDSGGGITALAVNPKGTLLAAAGKNFKISLVKPDSLKAVRTLKGHDGLIRDLAFNRSGATLASASADKSVLIWNLSKGRIKFTLEGHKHEVTQVVFSPKKDLVFSGDNQGTIRAWDAKKGNLVSEFAAKSGKGILALAASPDGKTLAASDGRELLLWPIAEIE